MTNGSENQRRGLQAVGRALVVYLGVAVGLLEVADILTGRFNLPGWTFEAVGGALILGFPVVLATAWLSASGAREAHTARSIRPLPLHLRLLTWRFALLGFVAAFALIGVVQAGGWLARAAFGPSEADWARTEGFRALEEYAEVGQWEEGFPVAIRVREALPNDSAAQELAANFVSSRSIYSEPAGAAVFRRPLAENQPWVEVGSTPLEDATPRVPHLYRLEADGHMTWWGIPGRADTVRLGVDSGGPHADLVEIRPEAVRSRNLLIPGFDHLRAPEAIATYRIDRFEVTNEQYQEFVEADGYARPELWAEALAAAAPGVDFEEAVGRFVDRTGRSGPSTWVAGDYPEGLGAHPVAGVSWFEAMAYAEFRDMELPTIWHWNRAAVPQMSQYLVPMANIDGGGETVPVGTSGSANRFGLFDMAGNVREWVYNTDTEAGTRFILGGGWDDPAYAFNDAQGHDPWDRSPTNGLRLAVYDDPEHSSVAFAREAVSSPVRDFYAEQPVSDEVFEVYRAMFAYDPMPLNAVVEDADTTDDAIRERVTFDAAYDGDRLQAYVYRPVSGSVPHQVVIRFPGSGAIYQRESRLGTGYLDYIVKSGRALILPLYKGTYERGGELDSDYPEESTRFRNYLIQWVQDVNRTIDYVESRPDLDESKVAYHGFSWGGYLGGIIPAVTPRLSTVVLYVAGLTYQRALPEGEAINYLPRITQPVLMVNGEYDYFFPVETSQRPMFDLLGTPDELKRWIVYPGGHNVPRDMLIKETLDWLDLRLGAVED